MRRCPVSNAGPVSPPGGLKEAGAADELHAFLVPHPRGAVIRGLARPRRHGDAPGGDLRLVVVVGQRRPKGDHCGLEGGVGRLQHAARV